MHRKIIFLLLFTFPMLITAQNLNGSLSSSVYSFKRYDSLTESKNNLRSFQTLNLNFNVSDLSVRTRMNLETNFSNSLDQDPRLRFYNLYLEYRKIFDMFTLRLGRQSLFNGVGSGVFDGVNLKFYDTGITVTGFFGGNVPAYQKMEFTDDLANDYILNGKIVVTAVQNFRFALNYVDKNFKAKDYVATRMDENLNPIEVLIEQKSNQFKFLTGEISYDVPKALNLSTRYDYDINFKTTSRFELMANYTELDEINFNVYYNYREPRVRYNSIFSVFNFGNTQEIEGGIDYKISQVFTVAGKFGYVTYDDDNSQRLTLALNSNIGSVSYRKTFGYAGELDAFSIYTAKSYFDGFLTPSIGFSYTSYKLSEEADKNTLLAILGGVNVRPFNALSVDLQGQYLNNKIYKNDFRVLAKINYWFNTNF